MPLPPTLDQTTDTEWPPSILERPGNGILGGTATFGGVALLPMYPRANWALPVSASCWVHVVCGRASRVGPLCCLLHLDLPRLLPWGRVTPRPDADARGAWGPQAVLAPSREGGARGAGPGVAAWRSGGFFDRRKLRPAVARDLPRATQLNSDPQNEVPPPSPDGLEHTQKGRPQAGSRAKLPRDVEAAFVLFYCTGIIPPPPPPPVELTGASAAERGHFHLQPFRRMPVLAVDVAIPAGISTAFRQHGLSLVLVPLIWRLTGNPSSSLG
ncbi:uncharacterized protein LOC103095762 isoform X4 [Monodelphis domestica]|uniref:uncharacterized protein LOC103095762 isoform X4 n=1 Tax=Monodelphis domestica TaxID=13616 RepID=UPI0024E19ABE|nr:uncharacterized protein LOC103095762 isoform X4 [Monodelphis domestica]